MSETILKQGAGTLYTVYNDTAQPGKTLNIYDGSTVLAILPLDKVLSHIEMRDDEEVEVPGCELNVAFQQELHIETDGQNLRFAYV